MSNKISNHKLSFENRLIRFLAFDLLLGLGLAGIELADWLETAAGLIAIYLLLTSIVGYGPVEMLVRRFMADKNR